MSRSMKRCISVLLSLLVLCSLTGCDSFNDVAYSVFSSFSQKGESIADFNTVTRFYRSQLSGTDAEDYDTLLMAYSRYENDILGLKSDLKRISQISHLVTLDYPELFWVTNSGYYYSDSTFWLFFSSGPLYTPNYRYSIEEISEYQKEIREISSKIAFENKYSTDYEKALAAYDYIIDNTEYDVQTADEILTNDDYDIVKDSSQCIVSTFIDHKSVCAGYSAAYQFLLGSMGIESAGVIGKIDNPSANNTFDHEWNVLKLDGEYYYTDITWGEMNEYDSAIEYGYFCLNSKEMFAIHIPSDKEYLPNTDAYECNYFFQNERLFNEYDIGAIRSDLINAVSNNCDYICFKYSKEEDYNKMVNALFLDGDYDFAFIFSDMEATNHKFILRETSFVSSPDTKTVKILLNYKN